MKAFPTVRPTRYEDDTFVPTFTTIKHKPVFGKSYDPISWHRRCMKWHERRCWAHQGEMFKYHYFAYHWHAKRYHSLVS